MTQAFGLSPAEWFCLRAIIQCLIPADDTWPGACEAGVDIFIQRQLTGPYGAAERWYTRRAAVDADDATPLIPRDLYRAGLAETDRIGMGDYGATFGALTNDDQIALLQTIEAGTRDRPELCMAAFFNLVLENTLEGYFADPIHGGNRDARSWHMIGFPGCGHDYATLITSHRNQKLPVLVQTIEMRHETAP